MISVASLASEIYIIIEYLQEDVTLNKQEVEVGWLQAQNLDPYKSKKVCVITAPYSLLSDEARTFVMKEMRSWPKVAVVVHNLAQILMGNFALTLSGKSKQIKIFKNKEEANNWLLKEK